MIKWSTKDTFYGTILQSWKREQQYYKLRSKASIDYTYPPLNDPVLNSPRDQSNVIDQFVWSSDGNCLISRSQDGAIRLYIGGSDANYESDSTNDTKVPSLVPIQRIFRPQSALCFAVNPGFNLYNDDSFELGHNNFLLSERELPLKLLSLVPTDSPSPLQYYHYEDSAHEKLHDAFSCEYITTNSFVVGCDSRLGVFSTELSSPVESFKIDKFGIISSIAKFKDSSSRLNIASYSNKVAGIDLKSGELTFETDITTGNGVYQVIESDNCNYLYVLARKSDKIPILDRRMGLKQIDTLTGWLCSTNQKCYGGLLPQNKGLLVGDTEGIKLWEDCAIGIGGKSKKIATFGETIGCVMVSPENSRMVGFCVGSRDSDCQLGILER